MPTSYHPSRAHCERYAPCPCRPQEACLTEKSCNLSSIRSRTLPPRFLAPARFSSLFLPRGRVSAGWLPRSTRKNLGQLALCSRIGQAVLAQGVCMAWTRKDSLEMDEGTTRNESIVLLGERRPGPGYGEDGEALGGRRSIVPRKPRGAFQYSSMKIASKPRQPLICADKNRPKFRPVRKLFFIVR